MQAARAAAAPTRTPGPPAWPCCASSAQSQTHKTKGPYRRNVERGLVWLIRHQEKDGFLAKDCVSPMYSHGMATIALCEAFGLSGDRNVGVAAQDAVNYIVAAQNKNDCGWRYNAGDPGDTSVMGWQIMALKSAHMAGLNIGGQRLRHDLRTGRQVARPGQDWSQRQPVPVSARQRRHPGHDRRRPALPAISGRQARRPHDGRRREVS